MKDHVPGGFHFQAVDQMKPLLGDDRKNTGHAKERGPAPQKRHTSIFHSVLHKANIPGWMRPRNHELQSAWWGSQVFNLM